MVHWEEEARARGYNSAKEFLSVSYWTSHMTLAQIAQEVDLRNTKAVRYAFMQYGVRLPNGNVNRAPGLRQKWIKDNWFRAPYLTAREIAKEWGCQVRTALHTLQKNKAPFRRVKACL